MIDCADFLQRLGKDTNTLSDTAVVSIASELLLYNIASAWNQKAKEIKLQYYLSISKGRNGFVLLLRALM